jgi:tetratricopeptide (TPR) repeat protein
LTDSHLALAWELHFADKYDECLAILNRILAAEAGHLQARSCRADTLIHLERYDEALTDAEHVIAKDESDDRAWEAKADVIEHRHDWLGLLTVSEKWLAAARKPKGRRREAHRYLAIAFCALERDSEMDQSLAAYVTSIRFRSPEGARLRAAIMRRSTFRRAGRPVPPDPLLDSRKLKR